MLKKFVPLNGNASPSKNPYEVRTYMGGNVDGPEWQVELCTRERKCDFPANSTISKVLTIEDELRRLQQKAKESRYQRILKKRCAKDDEFTACTLTQRTPKDIRSHAVLREEYMKMAFELSRRVHDASEMPVESPSRVELQSPEMSDDEGREDDSEEEEEEQKPVKPKLASPTCSLDAIYMPPQKMLELKRPKSGMFHNESQPPPEPYEDGIPYSSYNPRVLQEKFNDQKLETIDLIEGRDPNDLWTWNIGLQKRESEMDRAFIEATVQNFDCNNMELTTFKIPKDLDKTFSAEIVFGTEHVEPEPPPRKKKYYNRPKEVACLFAAYVESFRFNPDFWTSEILDGILVTAEKLLKKSNTLNYKASKMDFDVVPQLMDKQAEIGLKVHFTGPLESEPNIYKVLSLYFSKYNAAVLCAPNLYLLLWKRCTKTFYVFDPYGRNELCQRDFENGNCSLMAVNYVEHLVHLIVSFSQVDMSKEFNLYEIFLKNYGKITNPLPTKPFQKRTRRLWAVVNGTYAVIPAANNGLHQPISGNGQNASMIIALLALLYSDIERASLWRMEVIDDLIKFGNVYYKNFMKRLKVKKKQHLNVVDLPEVILMGTFRATVEKAPFLFTGHVTNCKTFLESQLTVVVRDLFTSKWEAALLQIDNLVMALWRDMEYFYLFDPFRRGKAGQVLDPDDYLAKGVACLQMHTNFESFCRILFQKAIKMRRGGKFFLHGVNIGCIKPVINAPIRSKYPRLQLVYPSIIAEPPKPEKKDKKKDKKGKKGKKSVERTYSIESIQDDERIPEFEDIDVVTTMLEEVLCDIFEMMLEPLPSRPQLYKQAEKVLLRSDKDYLESLKYKLKHGEDFDNVYSTFQMHPEPLPRALTLEEELQIRTNYSTLPDGSWVIMGNMDLPMMDDDSNKLCGLLSSLITAALTAKYNVSTWNSELIDYALESAEKFASMYTGYEQTLGAFLSKTLPKISIGDTVYRILLERVIKSSMTRSLRQMLLESLINFNRLLVICQRFSCLIVKRYNFLYMFIGFPCTPVGYRKFFNGPACMLRFVELDSLIRRIEFGCNPQGCEITNYVAVAIKVIDANIEAMGRFREWRASEEERMYCTELEHQKKIEQMKLDKIRFLDKELRKENERIQAFLTEKEMRVQMRKEAMEAKRSKTRYKKKKDATSMTHGSEGEEFLEELEMEEWEEEEEDEIELKHKPGKKLQRERAFPFKPRPILYGYHMREKDCLFKIQGTTALTGRDESAVDKIKPCFFVSTLAVLYAILRPLNQWSAQRVDRVIENGRTIASRVTNLTSAFERFIKNVTVDEYKFDLWVKTFDPVGVSGTSVGRKVAKATQTRRYLLLQISNTTYAIYRDENFHLFDPYATMETMVSPAEGEEEEGGTKHKCPAGIKKYGERNTASWVLFADVDAMLKYIDNRAANEEWQAMDEYAFHVVDVVSYKKAGPRTRILQLLTDLSVPMECKISQHGEDESTICAHPETISWLELESCLPVWSRMNRRNTAGRYRNLPVTKMKRYDIEIDGRLWSLWGNLHPQAPVFEPISRGKQYLACNVMACCAARVYQLTDWSPHLLDTIVINGDRYHRESLESIKQLDYEFSLEDLNMDCMLENIKFVVHLEHVAFGKLYSQPTRTTMNLADALMYFFGYFQFGILQCHKRSLAIGRTLGHDGGYFMFDCQSRDHPLFPKGQGASYLLRTKHLQVLLYCIVVTLNVPYYNVQFTLHKVEMLREGAPIEEDQEEET